MKWENYANKLKRVLGYEPLSVPTAEEDEDEIYTSRPVDETGDAELIIMDQIQGDSNMPATTEEKKDKEDVVVPGVNTDECMTESSKAVNE